MRAVQALSVTSTTLLSAAQHSNRRLSVILTPREYETTFAFARYLRAEGGLALLALRPRKHQLRRRYLLLAGHRRGLIHDNNLWSRFLQLLKIHLYLTVWCTAVRGDIFFPDALIHCREGLKRAHGLQPLVSGPPNQSLKPECKAAFRRITD